MDVRFRVVIAGGGIAGLAAARAIHLSHPDVGLTLVEAAPRLGGKMTTHTFSGHRVDVGPDAVLVRVPAMAALLDDLGLSGSTVAPAPLGAYLWSRGTLRRLPAGTMFGVPDRIVPLLRSRLLSPAGLLRAAFDLVLPRGRLDSGDVSIADLVLPRLGRQLFDRLVDPLLGGVHAGRAAELSARSVVPDIDALARSERSLYLGLRRRRRRATAASATAASATAASGTAASRTAASGTAASTTPAPTAPAAPALVTVPGGLGTIVEALERRLGDADVRLGAAVTRIARADDGYVVTLADGETLDADAVVVAAPAFAAAQMLAGLAPAAAELLGQIPYVDVATVWLAYRRSSLTREMDGTGFLVPPEEGRLLVGCTWSGAKWPHLAADDTVLIRCMVGRRGDRRWMALGDHDLVRAVHGELVEAMGAAAPPVDHHIQRWPQAMPQYVVGHADRLDAIDAELSELPGIFLTGAAYRGVGVASCVADATRVAAHVQSARADAAALYLTEVLTPAKEAT